MSVSIVSCPTCQSLLLSDTVQCPNCQRVYHDTFQPPQKADECDDCGTTLVRREDDRPDAVRNRLEVYERQTTPVLEHYRDAGKLVEIDGEQAIDAVQNELSAAVG